MRIEEFLSPEGVSIREGLSSKTALLHQIASEAAAKVSIPPDQIETALIKRERLGSTGIGKGVAIPHARFADLEKPFGLQVKLRRPIDFDAIDGQTVDLFFVLLLPEESDHGPVKALAAVAQKLRSPSVVDRARKAGNGRELYDALVRE